MSTNEGYRQVKITQILGKQFEIQRCKKENDGVVQFLCIGQMEFAS